MILTQPKGYTKKRTKLMPLFHLFCRKYPAIIEAMARRHEMYNQELAYIAQEEQAGRALVICPSQPLAIGRTELNPPKMQSIYQQGRQVALAQLDKIKEFL